MKLLLHIAAILALCAVAFAATEAGFALRQGRKDEITLAAQYSQIGQQVSTTLAAVNSEVPVEKQRVQNESQDLQKATTAIKDLMQHTDFALNGRPGEEGTLPQATATLAATERLTDASRGSIVAAGDALTATQKQIEPILLNLSATSSQIATQTPPILTSLSQSAANTATGTARLADAAESVKASATDVQTIADKVRSDFMHPGKRIWHYFLTALGIASDAGNASKL